MNTLDQVRAIIADEAGVPTEAVGPNESLATGARLGLNIRQRAEAFFAVCRHFGLIKEGADNSNKASLRTAAEIAAWVDVVKADQAQASAPVKFHGHGPITRAEVLARGVDDADDVTALSLIAKLGWPTEAEPMGTAPTHRIVPIMEIGETFEGGDRPLVNDEAFDRDLLVHGIAVTKDGERIPPEEFLTPAEIAADLDAVTPAVTPAASPFAFRKKPVTIEAVRFLKIEDAMAHFDVALARDLPEWVGEAMAGAEEQPNSMWIGRAHGYNVLCIGVGPFTSIVPPGDWIVKDEDGDLRVWGHDLFDMTFDPA